MRFPIEPVSTAYGVALGVTGGHQPGDPRSGLALLADLLGVSYSTMQRRQRTGLDPYEADRAAHAVGLHPALLWPDWFAADEEPAPAWPYAEVES